jgi:phosphate transport system ATP-binding protein
MSEYISIKDLSVRFGSVEALKNVNLEIPRNQITTVFGPANSGKTVLMRSINRMIELTPSMQRSGDITINDESIFRPEVDVAVLRRRVSMVFALPTPLPMSIYENVIYGLRLMGEKRRDKLDAQVQYGLEGAALWNEVRNRLHDPALSLSGGQQQRLCLARSLALDPDILLLDAPTAALDPISTALIEETMIELKARYTIILVPHNFHQGARVADRAAFFLGGECIETGTVSQIFTAPQDSRTEDYVSGRFG